MKRFLFVVAVIIAAVIRPKDFAMLATTPPVNTNITAYVTATAISDHEIVLNMSAISRDGEPVTGFNVYQNGVWIATVTNVVTTRGPASPTTVVVAKAQ